MKSLLNSTTHRVIESLSFGARRQRRQPGNSPHPFRGAVRDWILSIFLQNLSLDGPRLCRRALPKNRSKSMKKQSTPKSNLLHPKHKNKDLQMHPEIPQNPPGIVFWSSPTTVNFRHSFVLAFAAFRDSRTLQNSSKTM